MRGAAADGGSIQSLRRARGLTQEELAKRAVCDVKTVRKAEKNGRLDLATLHRLAAALDVSTPQITRSADDSPGKQQANLRSVLSWLDAFNRRDVEGLVATFRADGVSHIPGADDIPSGGTYRGAQELHRHFTEAFQLFQTECITPDMYDIHAEGDFVVLRGYARVVHIPSGRQERCYVVHEFRFQKGKIAEMYITTDTRAFYRLARGEDRAD
jgi:transcriptional regulator with XRE-family HTH domain